MSTSFVGTPVGNLITFKRSRDSFVPRKFDRDGNFYLRGFNVYGRACEYCDDRLNWICSSTDDCIRLRSKNSIRVCHIIYYYIIHS